MHYININDTGIHIMNLNSFVGAGSEIDWVILKEGDDTPLISFTAALTNGNYYQMLSIDLDAITLSKDAMYTIEGSINASAVYRGKFIAVDGEMTPSSPISIHKDLYTPKTDTNDYIILE